MSGCRSIYPLQDVPTAIGVGVNADSACTLRNVCMYLYTSII